MGNSKTALFRITAVGAGDRSGWEAPGSPVGARGQNRMVARQEAGSQGPRRNPGRVRKQAKKGRLGTDRVRTGHTGKKNMLESHTWYRGQFRRGGL